MTVTVYGIPNCDQIRKTRRWLDLHGVDHRFHDYRSDGLDRATLEDWQARVGLSEVINTRSQTWRTLDEAQRKAVADVSTDAVYELLLAHPTLIKRPIVTTDARPDELQIGFQEDELRAFLRLP